MLDFTASYQLSDGFKVYGRLENALDEEYQEVIGYNAADSAVYVGLNFRFTGR